MIKMLVMTVDHKQLLEQHQAIQQSFTFFISLPLCCFWFGFIFLMDLKFHAKLALCKEIKLYSGPLNK